MKSIYGGRCDFALLRSRERTGFMLDILKAIDVMELAVKYDSKVLFQSMTGYIVGLTSVVPATRRFAILEATIDAHYGVGTRMRSPVDKVLAVLASSEGGWFVRTTDFKNLISRYSAFATDVALVSMQDSTIDMLRHFCDECDSKTMVTWQEVQESGRQLIRCWACGLLARIPMRPSQSEEHILPSRLARCYSFEE